MRGAQLFEMVETRGQPLCLLELKLYMISKSRAEALDLREERREEGEDLTTARPLGPPDISIIVRVRISVRILIILKMTINI